MTILRFDRGTLELSAGAPDVPHAIWDPRSETRRVAAHRFGRLVEAVESRGVTLDGDLRLGWQVQRRDCTPLALRPYQAQALASWIAFARRGVVALPTGAGKTRVALAALFDTGLPAAILCPTKALAVAWVEELQRHLVGEPVGLVGDGHRTVERVTVMTFESAYRHMDKLGDRFGLLVVDEVHHFGSGARVEALEASAAIARLGLTATAPDPGSEGAARLAELVGAVVFEMGYSDLVGKHLAPVTVIKIPVRLDVDERAEYDARTRAFLEMRRTFMRLYPGADVATMLRGLGRSFEGRRALRDRAGALELACFPRAKRSLLRTLLTRHRDDRTIVFTAFAENAYVAAKDNLVPVITGETGAKERQEILASFREGKCVRSRLRVCSTKGSMSPKHASRSSSQARSARGSMSSASAVFSGRRRRSRLSSTSSSRPTPPTLGGRRSGQSMLPSRLLDCERTDDGRIVPRWLLPRDEPWLRELVHEAIAADGRAVSEVDERILEMVAPLARRHGAGRRLVEAVWTVERRRWSLRTSAPVPPRTIRRVLFELAAERSREEALVTAGVALGLEAAQVESLLFADRPRTKLLVAPSTPATTSSLAEAYNLALVQSLLGRATER